MQSTELFFSETNNGGAAALPIPSHTLLYVKCYFPLFKHFFLFFQYFYKYFFATLCLFTHGILRAAHDLGYLRRGQLDHKVILDDLTVFVVKGFYRLDQIIVPRSAAYLVD